MSIIDSHANEGKRRKEIKIRCCWFRKRSKKEVPGLCQPILTPAQPCHPLILTALGKTPRLSLTLWSKLSLFLEAVSIVIIHEVLDHDKFNLIYFVFLSHFLFFFLFRCRRVKWLFPCYSMKCTIKSSLSIDGTRAAAKLPRFNMLTGWPGPLFDFPCLIFLAILNSYFPS